MVRCGAHAGSAKACSLRLPWQKRIDKEEEEAGSDDEDDDDTEGEEQQSEISKACR